MSGFAYINPTQAMLEMTLEALGGGLATFGARHESSEVVAERYELDDSWKKFEKELGAFKRDLARVRRDLNQKCARLTEIQKSSEVTKMILENLPSEDLKARISSVLDSYETEEGTDALAQQCGELKGEYEAKMNVLQNTEAERYEKFTCFVCQERLIDLFIDPCGHVMCERCWANTRDKSSCPGCRQRCGGARKIYTM